jgi:hypothetical protein
MVAFGQGIFYEEAVEALDVLDWEQSLRRLKSSGGSRSSKKKNEATSGVSR